ncbi:MAG: HAMP domain-containing histidine kinase [Muribaculaceae bacterium]|nr:HAMP domain-containing histidine kinase [Muribaculaceae bacterium]
MKYFLAIIGIVATLIPATELFASNKAKIDSLYAILQHTTSPADSLKTLYNIHDLGTKEQNRPLNPIIYNVAKRAGNTSARLDILRILGNFYLGNDSAQQLILDEARSIPPSAEQKETVTFLKLLIEATHALYTDSDTKQRWLIDALDKYSTNKNSSDKLANLEQIYTVCIYLGSTVNGNLLDKYIDESEEMIDGLPYGLYALRNMFFAHSAIIHTRSEEHDKAVAADRRLLEIMDGMEKDYTAKGRIYKNYDRNRYVSYRRMLCNYPALTATEVEDIYSRIQKLAAGNEEIAEDLAETKLPDIYYHMARKEYDKAIDPLVEATAMDVPGNNFIVPRLYKMLIEASKATGNKEILLNSLLKYNDIQSDYIKTKSDERYRELQIIYDVDNLNLEKNAMEAENQKTRIRLQRTTIVISTIFVIALIVLCIVLLNLYRRSRSLSKELARSNSSLKTERDNLQQAQTELIAARDAASRANKLKTTFIDNMSRQMQEPIAAIAGYTQFIVDNLNDKDRLRLEKYSNLVVLNTELLLTMVYDVLTISELNKKKLTLIKSDVSVKMLCDVALNSVMSKKHPGVEMVYAKSPDEDIEIHTDPQRVQQVLVNLLQNAVKFTMSGRITLDWDLSPDKTHITFSVTDTGCGIPADKSEIIFERFEKLNSYKEGVGLGLPISRTVAALLKGDVSLDTSYTDGARFLFTIPCRGN